MEEKMQREKQKGREDGEKINDVDMKTHDDEDIEENQGTIDTYYNNEIEKIPAAEKTTSTTTNDGTAGGGEEDGITKPTTFRNTPIVVSSTATTESTTAEEDEENGMLKKTVTEISVEKVNVIEIRPDGSSGHIIPSMIYQASQT